MNIKSLLIMAAASVSLSAVSASAADMISDDFLDVPEPPVLSVKKDETVALCDVAGTGYFKIPGSETCLKIGGSIDVRGGYARTKQSLGGVQVGSDRGGRSRVEASFDLDTYASSEIGDIRTKARVGLRHYDPKFHDSEGEDFGIELAYVGVGPMYAGYKETLFHTNLAYGDYMNLDERSSFNTMTVGFMDQVAMGFYVGLAVEDWNRNQFIRTYKRDGDTPDIVARFGIADQSWGGSDLSVIYSEHLDFWAVKSTTDVNVADATQARFSASYLDTEDDKTTVLTAGIKQGLTEKIHGFGGFGYGWTKNDQDAYLANAGVVYSVVPGFDISGELGYTRFEEKNVNGKTEDVSAMVRFLRSW